VRLAQAVHFGMLPSRQEGQLHAFKLDSSQVVALDQDAHRVLCRCALLLFVVQGEPGPRTRCH
jgi:hypothetical protein